MLTFKYEDYTVTVTDVTALGFDTASTYDAFYLEDKGNYTSLQAICVYCNGLLVNSVLLGSTGGSIGVYEHTALITDAHLVTCCCDKVFCLSLPDLQLLWKTKADLATCFAVYPYRQDYIVHGEVEISRLDQMGNIVWQNGGSDIFVTLNGGSSLVLLEDTIIAIDFEFSKYVFDYDGRMISYAKQT